MWNEHLVSLRGVDKYLKLPALLIDIRRLQSIYACIILSYMLLEYKGEQYMKIEENILELRQTFLEI